MKSSRAARSILLKQESKEVTPVVVVPKARRTMTTLAAVKAVSDILVHCAKKSTPLLIQVEFAGGKVDPVEAGKKGGNS